MRPGETWLRHEKFSWAILVKVPFFIIRELGFTLNVLGFSLQVLGFKVRVLFLSYRYFFLRCGCLVLRSESWAIFRSHQKKATEENAPNYLFVVGIFYFSSISGPGIRANTDFEVPTTPFEINKRQFNSQVWWHYLLANSVLIKPFFEALRKKFQDFPV